MPLPKSLRLIIRRDSFSRRVTMTPPVGQRVLGIADAPQIGEHRDLVIGAPLRPVDRALVEGPFAVFRARLPGDVVGEPAAVLVSRYSFFMKLQVLW